MINKLYKLREYIPPNVIDESPYGLVLDERPEQVIVINFSMSDSLEFEFKGSHLEKFSRHKNETQFYFKQAKGMATSEFPTFFFTYKDISEDASYFSGDKNGGKLIKILQKYSKKSPVFTNLINYIDKNSQIIKDSIAEKMQGRKNDGELYILTLNINDNYIGESPIFKTIRDETEQNLLGSYYTLNNKEIRPKNKICSVCLKSGQEVWGYVSTFNFYTAKTEFAPIAGGFDKSSAWKNYPVCPECAVKLKQSGSVIRKNMRYYFCGFSYFIIPEFINAGKDNHDLEDNHKIMDIFLDKETAIGRFSLSDETRNTLTNTEGEILDILQESDNRVNYTLFFFEENNSEFKILLSVEDVYPSQFKTIFNAKEQAENHSIFKGLEKKKDKEAQLYDLKFHFEFVKEFIPLSQDKTLGNSQVFEKHFLDIARAVFLQKKIDSSFIMHRIAESMRRRFVNINYDNEGEKWLYNLSVLKMILTLKFFNNLGIIDLSAKHDEKEVVVEDKYQKFFEEHSDFFDCSSKKAVFLEGVLCQNLLSIQRRKRNATPFRKKLNGLKMNPKVIRKLLPEMIEKLEQYEENYLSLKTLEEAISTLLLDSKLEKLSNDELSFYFVMGMNLSRVFYTPKEENDTDKLE
ncbi:MAG: TIGR02556 family CRISPR-associated protein [Desulfamplus sp.]|nr:TIGR02556 family CRISPR-associated protein [Desulfamplus sp.]